MTTLLLFNLVCGLDATTPLPANAFTKIKRDSGKDSYFQVVKDADGTRIAADYLPPEHSETFGVDIPEPLRKRVKQVRWRWRVRTFPKGGDDCIKDKGDSAAGIFFTFKGGLKWMLLKYIWSETQAVGTVCDKRDSFFSERQTSVLESGDSNGAWRSEALDPKAEFVKHFGGKLSDVPDLFGLGLLTDGDQTKSPAAADYADFAIDADK